jgi:hypothetical protein|tara:strand:- start:18072 stop:18458 length:387 start_codon:yes stop_codon:yes gene_type:complete
MYEAARRFLRSDGGSLIVPEPLLDSANKLVLKISDELPTMVNEPTIESSSSNYEVVFSSEEGLDFSIANIEPGIGVCWINTENGDMVEIWNRLLEIIDGLARAGYPGCVGCGGPGSEEIWDEVEARKL